MTDIVDRAQEAEFAFREAALQAQRERAVQTTEVPITARGRVCRSCGHPIPAKRLKLFAHTSHCVRCATAQERGWIRT